MSYVALYRKFRPSTFDEVKGQDHIVKTLKNQMRTDRLGHAYLFCGTRGTGKTSVAKILAKAVNCEHPIDGSPCNECPACRSIQAGTSMNVIEIDAASNNGVDNIREIREEVAYRPTEGRFKVYIIDEVHMLSIRCFQCVVKDTRGTAGVCDFYSGNDRGAIRFRSRFFRVVSGTIFTGFRWKRSQTVCVNFWILKVCRRKRGLSGMWPRPVMVRCEML